MLIEIDQQSDQPIFLQLRDQIVLGIASKQLVPGEALPSVRRLAADIGINLHTVNKAYAVLSGEGYIVMDRRKRATIAVDVPGDLDFVADLKRRLTLAAAEAQCHDIDEEKFIVLCRECYKNAGTVS